MRLRLSVGMHVCIHDPTLSPIHYANLLHLYRPGESTLRVVKPSEDTVTLITTCMHRPGSSLTMKENGQASKPGPVIV